MDLRQYAERMAAAQPKRFKFDEQDLCDPTAWVMRQAGYPILDFSLGSMLAEAMATRKAWAFIGPLLDELKIETDGLNHFMCCDTWLESAFNAVANHLEEA